jgi:hypothetical protein
MGTEIEATEMTTGLIIADKQNDCFACDDLMAKMSKQEND